MTELTDDGRVRRLPMIEEEECAALIASLEAERLHWFERGRAFFTLGAATYLDACGIGSRARYSTRSAIGNAVLSRTFRPLLGRLRDLFETQLGRSCRFREDLALPGFHIFLARALDAALRDQLHLDLQHRYIDERFDLDTPSFTFTLPLELPAAGGGIELCLPCAHDKRGRLVTHEYRRGELFIHSGRALHRRIHRPATPQCRRITLQGHGVRAGEDWVLYW